MGRRSGAFEELVAEAVRQPFSGWDFSYLQGRMESGDPQWDYAALVRRRLPGVRALLELGTGGGEFLRPHPGRLLSPSGASLSTRRGLEDESRGVYRRTFGAGTSL